MSSIKNLCLILGLGILGVGQACASEITASGDVVSQLVEVTKYSRAIHIMAMLLVGFGFLMVFVKKYGRGALTATYLLVSIAIPLYYLKSSLGIFGHAGSDIDRMILSEFAAASLLITAGAVLGRLRLNQYLLLGLFFVPCYAMNEWILLDDGFGLIAKGAFVDMGGSVAIHLFGALFGLGAIISLTTKKQFETKIEADQTSDIFSLLGSMVLWIFWPSFCSALVEPAMIPMTIVNVIIALCASTLATFFASSAFRKKVAVADIANAALAGGVAIGSVCDKATVPTAFLIGLLAGVISTFGFAVIQGRFQSRIKKIDTCGVLYLHGLPGLLGGIAALFVVGGIDSGAQIKGIMITIAIALVSGLLTGKVISLFKTVEHTYDDEEEMV